MQAPSLFQQTMHPRCPRCSVGKLFQNSLRIVDHCDHCGLVLKHHDAADAPTFFALVIIGLAVTIGAALVEIQFKPPLWVHAALWIPLTFIGSMVALRVFKALFVTLEYRVGVLKERDPHA